MNYIATAKYIRMSPRKVRVVATAVKKFTPAQALVYLGAATRYAAGPLAKAISSALASAKSASVDIDKLKFRAIEIGVGPAMKRMRAVSRGQGHGYKKRMSHIRVVLTDDKGGN